MKTCLIVDDSAVMRRIARRIIEEIGGFEISEAGDGEEAFAFCQTSLPDAILLDWNMPKMDGFEFLLALRRMSGGDKPKVILCISEDNSRLITRALHAGANDCALKPLYANSLAEKLRDADLI